ALIALSWIGDASAVPMILDRLRVETSAEVKKYVAEALGVLLKHRFEWDYAKRRGTPMEQYAVNDTVPYLAEASATAREPETRKYLISALGEIGFLMGGIWRVLSNLEILMNSAPQLIGRQLSLTQAEKDAVLNAIAEYLFSNAPGDDKVYVVDVEFLLYSKRESIAGVAPEKVDEFMSLLGAASKLGLYELAKLDLSKIPYLPAYQHGATKALARLLTDENETVRTAARRALLEIATPDAIRTLEAAEPNLMENLINTLRNDKARSNERTVAAYALRFFADGRALRALVDALSITGSPAEDIMVNARRSIIEMLENAIENGTVEKLGENALREARSVFSERVVKLSFWEAEKYALGLIDKALEMLEEHRRAREAERRMGRNVWPSRLLGRLRKKDGNGKKWMPH
ncbi:MAG: hypothetical protein QXP42_00890, partial [Candidatus Micrarchaeia archaeon]